MSEWDERFARLQGLFKERINQAVPKGDPLGFAEPSEWMIIRGLRDLARESRAQLAQRDEELTVLRAAAKRVTMMWRWTDADRWDSDEWDESHDSLAALSDDQEGRDE